MYKCFLNTLLTEKTPELNLSDLNAQVTITTNDFISQLGLTATRVLRASIRIVAGQASKEAVGCELVDRSASIDPSVTDRLPIVIRRL